MSFTPSSVTFLHSSQPMFVNLAPARLTKSFMSASLRASLPIAMKAFTAGSSPEPCNISYKSAFCLSNVSFSSFSLFCFISKLSPSTCLTKLLSIYTPGASSSRAGDNLTLPASICVGRDNTRICVRSFVRPSICFGRDNTGELESKPCKRCCNNSSSTEASCSRVTASLDILLNITVYWSFTGTAARTSFIISVSSGRTRPASRATTNTNLYSPPCSIACRIALAAFSRNRESMNPSTKEYVIPSNVDCCSSPGVDSKPNSPFPISCFKISAIPTPAFPINKTCFWVRSFSVHRRAAKILSFKSL
mmetsp:Transcript_60657/g.96303  ORF Transcript_60657/g.96303 Transcript_60657/m.96303 type:complete len:306 (+) Transcript_60657:129-1046(+)